jgi:hypothetical protein
MEGSLAGDREVYVDKALEALISSHKVPVGEPVRWLGEKDERGSRDGTSQSEAKRGPQAWAGKICSGFKYGNFHRGSFMAQNLQYGGTFIYWVL